MKIAIIGSKDFDSLEYHIHDELTHQGKTAQIFDFISYFPQKIEYGFTLLSNNYVEFRNKILLQNVLEFKPDLVIVVYRHIHPFFVKEVKKAKIKIIHINPDALTTFQSQQIFVEPYDEYYSKDPYIVKFLKNKLNLNAKLYSEAFNNRIHKRPLVELNYLEELINIDVLCYGNLYPYRNKMLQILIESGNNVNIFGNRAKYFPENLEKNYEKKGIYGEEKAKILNGAKIVFNNFHYAEIESVNNKFFEINGSGGFQICDYRPILNELLPIDPRLVSFETISDANNLIKYYLDKPEKRYEIRDVIMKYFLENFTYKNMLDSILK
jgi:spore maturation protein CgeB